MELERVSVIIFRGLVAHKRSSGVRGGVSTKAGIFSACKTLKEIMIAVVAGKGTHYRVALV